MNIFIKIHNLANILDQKGLHKEADVMDCILKQAITTPGLIPDNQLNIENENFIGGPSPIGGGYGMLGIDEAMRAEDGLAKDIKVYLARSETLLGSGTLSYENGVFTLKYMVRPDNLPTMIKGSINKIITGSGYLILISIDHDVSNLLGDFKGIKIEGEQGTWYPLPYFQEDYIRELLGSKPEKEEVEQDNVDVDVATINGFQGNTSIDRGMFSGLSDAYFYRPPGSIEENI